MFDINFELMNDLENALVGTDNSYSNLSCKDANQLLAFAELLNEFLETDEQDFSLMPEIVQEFNFLGHLQEKLPKSIFDFVNGFCLK